MIISVLFAFSPKFASAESWTDSTGKHSVTAEFLALEGDVVALRGVNGKRITIPLAKLDEVSRSQAEKLGNRAHTPIEGELASIVEADALERLLSSSGQPVALCISIKNSLQNPGSIPRKKQRLKSD